jgi:hypothetical protein
VYVAVEGFEADADLRRWIAHGEFGVASLPAKSARSAKAPRRRTKA